MARGSLWRGQSRVGQAGGAPTVNLANRCQDLLSQVPFLGGRQARDPRVLAQTDDALERTRKALTSAAGVKMTPDRSTQGFREVVIKIRRDCRQDLPASR
jgi:hypothetical protein